MTRKTVYCKMGKTAGLALAVLICLAGVAAALDFNDIVIMKENQVSDAVVINMIRDSGGLILTPEQENHLRGMGVSEALLATARAAQPVPATTAYPAPSAPPVTVVEQPAGPVPVTEMAPLPSRYSKEGWVSVSNSGWESYYLLIDQRAKRMFLSQTPNGGVEIVPGQNIAQNIRKEGYKMYGNNGRSLQVKVREGEVTRVTLTPFGAPGGGGLTVSSQDREKVRSEMLFGVIIAPAPAVIVEPAPTIIYEPGPVIVPYRPYYHRPYPRGPGFGYGYRW